MSRIIFYSFISVITFSFFGCFPKKSNKNFPEPKPDSIIIEKQGLVGVAYGSTDLTRFDRIYPLKNICVDWDSTCFKENSDWSAEWEGYITVPVNDEITFFAETNREIIVKLAGTEILHVGEKNDKKEAKLVLSRGKQYLLNIIYIQKSGGKTFFKILWSWDGKEKHEIPSEFLNCSKEQYEMWNMGQESDAKNFDYTRVDIDPSDPIRIVAPELAKLDLKQSTGGLPVAPGLEIYTICRADREHPEKAEGMGYTYQHHQDLAAWKGRLYVGWNTCERDEDAWPSREVYSTSANGKDWSRPSEMFPQGVSTPLRMYFFLAPNGHMLMIAGLREERDGLTERKKNGIVVREINADHSLGDVFTLRASKSPVPDQPPMFDTSTDRIFVEACRQLLNDHLYLEQQDYGNLLDPEDRMKWNDPDNWEGNRWLKEEASNFGKAMCFYKRRDGAMVAVSKRRWVTVSTDGGISWSQPVRPESLITGSGKVWGQQTSDGRYALIYNPDTDIRYPLMMLTSDDGITFSNPFVLNGDLPPKRYPGKAKDPGWSYHRGLSEWNNDKSWKDSALWLVFSQNKEDILIARVPVQKNK